MDQRSSEWFAARLGKVTASRIADVVARIKTGYGASRQTYMNQLLDELMTGRKQDGFSNAAMQWGIETEPQARAAYEILTGNEVTEVGFVVHPTIDQAGASPDGLVGDDGMVEIKCPNTGTHRDFLLTGKIPKRYFLQMQWQMACCQRQWCDFVSFDPRLTDGGLHCKIERVEACADTIADLENEVQLFLSELNGVLQRINQLGEK